MSGEDDLRARLTALVGEVEKVGHRGTCRVQPCDCWWLLGLYDAVNAATDALATPDHLDCTRPDCTETVAPTAAKCGEGHPQARRGQWGIRDANGRICHSSEEVARAVAGGEQGYTLGADRAPVVAGLQRTDSTSEWEPIAVPAEPARESDGVGLRGALAGLLQQAFADHAGILDLEDDELGNITDAILAAGWTLP